MSDRPDHERAVTRIKPVTEGDVIYLRRLGFATVLDIGVGEIGAVLGNGETVLIREVGRNAAVRA